MVKTAQRELPCDSKRGSQHHWLHCYRHLVGRDHLSSNVSIRELFVLTTLVAVAITVWKLSYSYWIGDHPHEVFNDFVLGIRAYIDMHWR